MRPAPTTVARSRSPPQAGQRQSPASRPHQPQPATADRAAVVSGPAHAGAAGRGAVAGAGQGGDVAAPWHLDQHRGACRQGRAGGGERGGRQPGRPGERVAGEVVVGHALDARRDGPDHRPLGLERPGPAGGDEQLPLGGPDVPADQGGRAGQVRAQHEDVARGAVRRARLGVQVVAVVPHDDQAEVGHGRPGGRPGPDRDPHPAAPHGQPAPVALGRPEVGREDDVGHVAERGGDPGDVARVGQHHHRPPATGGAGGDGGRDLGRPVRPGQRGPDGPRRTPLGEGLAAARARPGSAPSVPGSGAAGGGAGSPAGSASTRACRGGRASRRTSYSVPAQRSATARASAATSSDSTGSGLTSVASGASARPLSVVAARARTTPSTSRPANRTRTRHARPGGLAEVGRHGVVEGPVEVGDPAVDGDPGHRQVVGDRPGRGADPGARPARREAREGALRVGSHAARR